MSQETEFEAPSVEELQTRFTQFRIENLVAVGGMGAVYRAVQLSVDRPVAFKILSSEYAENEKFRKRFALEAKAMAKLNHPNIVQLYDFGKSGDVIWMAQEWVPGQTVEQMLDKEGAMDPEEAAAMVAQACEGLGYAHKQGLVHRDVKPANMMQDREGNIKVMDFGLAHASYFEEPSLQTDEGARFATTEYAGPEIWDMEKEPDHRVDIFALGVLLCEALTGQTPGDPFRAPSEIRPELDPRFDKVVMRSMQPIPDNRYGSCRDFLQALKEVVMNPRGPAPGQLLTGSAAGKPISGPVAAPRATPVSTVPLSAAQAVPQAVPQAAPQAIPEEVALPSPAGKKANVLLWIVGVLAIVLAVVLGLIVVTRGKEEPKPEPGSNRPSAAELAGAASGTAAERAGQKETPQERVARLAREAQERLKRLEKEKKKNPPKKKPADKKPADKKPSGQNKPDPKKPDPKKDEKGN